jgi:hypothetical protein
VGSSGIGSDGSIVQNVNVVVYGGTQTCTALEDHLGDPTSNVPTQQLQHFNNLPPLFQSSTWQWIEDTAPMIGKYIPTACGGGAFAYAGKCWAPQRQLCKSPNGHNTIPELAADPDTVMTSAL